MPSSWSDSNGRGLSSLAYKASAIGHYATRAYQGRVLIGSTRNPTSTSEAFHPSLPMLFILPYKRSSNPLIILPIGQGVQLYWPRPSRPKNAFAALAIATSSSFPMSSYSPATSDPGIEPVLVSEPLVLGKDCYHLGLVDSHRKHVLRATGGEIRSRSAFLCGLYQTG